MDEVGSSPDILDLYGLPRADLAAILAERFEAREFCAQQLFEWVYRRRVCDFAEMSNIAKAKREEFKRSFRLQEGVVRERRVSRDGSCKYLIQVRPNILVESVLIHQPERKTLCVSSQYGCGMGCRFCRTASMGHQGNLSAGDIVRQVLAVIDDPEGEGYSFRNLVFMGMGEPLHNLAGIVAAIRILLDPFAFGLGQRRITVSTVGLVPAIKRLGAMGLGINLAVSLNATTDEVRRELMPVAKRWSIAELLHAVRTFPLAPRRRVTIGYVLMAGVNDSREDQARLVSLLKGMRVKVNLIPYNEHSGLPYRPPRREWILEWHDYLQRGGLDATIRWSKGEDIQGACGQLAVGENRGSGSNATHADRVLLSSSFL